MMGALTGTLRVLMMVAVVSFQLSARAQSTTIDEEGAAKNYDSSATKPAPSEMDLEKAALMEEVRSPDSVKPAMNAKQVGPKGALGSTGLTEYQYEGYSSTAGSAQNRKKIIDQAVAQISERAVISIIGEPRYRAKKNQMAEKIFKLSSRYIPVIKTGDFVETPEGHKLSVMLQVNHQTLQELLQKQGLLFDNEGVSLIMPFFSIDDQVRGGRYRWWKGEESRLKGLSEFTETQLQKTLFEMGFFVERPEAFQRESILASNYKQDELTPEQIVSLCNQWQIPLALVGNMAIRNEDNREIVFDVRASILQISTGRTMAQLYRQFRLPKRVQLENLNMRKDLAFLTQSFKDLGLQLQDALNRGVFSTTLVRLEVEGNFPIQFYAPFKEALRNAHRSIRQVRERVITAKGVIFELDINGDINEISSSLNRLVVGDRSYYAKGSPQNNTIKMAPGSLR